MSMIIKMYKWLVFVSGCYVTVVPMGICYSLGTLFVEFMTVFQASRAEASLIQFVGVAVSFSTAFLHGILIHRFGMVKIGLAGSLLASTGLGLSYFATSIPFLIVTIGIAMSIGSMCMYIVSSAAVGQHFTSRQSLILLSVFSAFSGIGGMLFSSILAFLTGTYGLRGTLLICAGLVMNTIPCALLRTKPRRKIKSTTVAEIKSTGKNLSSGRQKETRQQGSRNGTYPSDSVHQGNGHSRINNAYEEDSFSSPSIFHQNEHSPELNQSLQVTTITQFQQANSFPLSDQTNRQIRSNNGQNYEDVENTDRTHQDNSSPSAGPTQRHNDCKDTETNHSETEYKHNSQDITLSKRIKHLAKNRSFIFFIVGMAFSYPPVVILITFIVDAFEDSGLSQDNAHFGLFLLNAFSITGRLLPGIMIRSKYIKTMTMPIIASVVSAGCIAGFVLTDLLYVKLVLSSLSGICFGFFASCLNVTTMEIVGGFTFTLNDLAYIAAGPTCSNLPLYS